MTKTATLARGMGALAWLLIVLVAIPAALATLGGNPLPSSMPSGQEILSTLTSADDGTVLISAAVIIAWIGWASFAIPLLVQLACSITRIRAPRLPGLSFQQQRANVTVAALAAMISIGGASAATAAPSATPAATTTTSTAQAHTAAAATQHSADAQKDRGQNETQGKTKTTTVAVGDTLWQIADEELGEGSKYNELLDASRSTTQPGGQHLSDPDLIQPGWEITVPAQANAASDTDSTTPPSATKPNSDTTTSHKAAPAPPKSTPSPAATPPASTPSPSATSTPAPTAGQADDAQRAPLPSATSPQASSPPQASREAGSATTSSPPTTSNPAPAASVDQGDNNLGGYLVLGGLGVLALAGVLVLIDRLRNGQTRRRLPGRRVALPTGRAAITEAQIRTHADPVTADELNRAARTLAAYYASRNETLPSLRAARLTPGVLELYLIDDSADLPEPFTRDQDDPAVWLLDRTTLEDSILSAEEADQFPAPWPALVTLGQDEAGGALLVNLEELGSLALHGPAPLNHEVLSALVIELLTGAWTDDSRVTLCGVMPDLVDALGSDRVSYSDNLDRVLTGLEYSAKIHRDVLTNADIDSGDQARIIDAGDGDWTPQVLILGGDITPEQATRLEQLVATRPRVAVASITTSNDQVGQWSLTVAYTETSTTATLTGDAITLELTPQRIPTAHYQDLLEIARTAHEPDVAGPSWTDGIAPSEPIDVDDVPAPEDPSSIVLDDLVDAETVPDLTEIPDQDTEEQATPAPAAARLSTVDEHQGPEEEITQPEPKLNAEASNETAEETTSPDADVRVLPGPDQPHIRLLGPIDITGAAGPRPSAPIRCTEVIAYLALHPGGNSNNFTAAIFPGERPTGVGAKRNQYMRNSRAWLGTNSAGQPWVGMVPEIGYALDPSTEVDWWRFQRLIGDAIGTTSTDNLTSALRLVDGCPMSYPDEHRYNWADADKTEIIAAVVDVAHELATRAISNGDPRTATWATLKGLGADPTNEALWRLRITAAHQTGDPDQAQAAINACRNTLDDLGDLDTPTHDLINTVLTHA